MGEGGGKKKQGKDNEEDKLFIALPAYHRVELCSRDREVGRRPTMTGVLFQKSLHIKCQIPGTGKKRALIWSGFGV